MADLLQPLLNITGQILFGVTGLSEELDQLKNMVDEQLFSEIRLQREYVLAAYEHTEREIKEALELTEAWLESKITLVKDDTSTILKDVKGLSTFVQGQLYDTVLDTRSAVDYNTELISRAIDQINSLPEQIASSFGDSLHNEFTYLSDILDQTTGQLILTLETNFDDLRMDIKESIDRLRYEIEDTKNIIRDELSTLRNELVLSFETQSTTIEKALDRQTETLSESIEELSEMQTDFFQATALFITTFWEDLDKFIDKKMSFEAPQLAQSYLTIFEAQQQAVNMMETLRQKAGG